MTLQRSLLGVTLLLSFALVLGPILVIVLISFSPVDGFNLPKSALSLRWYSTFIASTELWGAMLFSFRIAVVAALASVGLGTMAAMALANRRGFSAGMLQSFLMAPMVFPAIVLGLAILLSVRASGAPLALGLVVAHVIIGTPYCFRMVLASLQSLDPTLEEASQSLGAGPLRTFVFVTMPLILPGMLAGALFAFIVSFGENNASLFLTSPGFSTMPIELLAFLQFPGNQLVVAAASTVQVGVILVLALTMERLVGLARILRSEPSGRRRSD